jgi:hypothetical protein
MYKISLSRNAHTHSGSIEMTTFYKKLFLPNTCGDNTNNGIAFTSPYVIASDSVAISKIQSRSVGRGLLRRSSSQ